MSWIRKRRYLRAVACAGWLALTGVAQAPAQTPPNVVLIYLDDAGFNEMGFQGNAAFETPNMDRLASSGARFTNAYNTASVCSPSRAGLLTGRCQQRFGHEFNHGRIPLPEIGLPVGVQTLADRLRRVGYHTGIVGKWHLGVTDGVFRPLDRGFDEFYGFLAGHHDYFKEAVDDAFLIRRGNMPDPTWATQGKYLTDAFGEEAAAFIERNSSRPFFLYLPFSGPHGPLQATQRDLDAFPTLSSVRKTRVAMMKALDRAVGLVLDTLKGKGLADNTLVILLSDNGGEFQSGGDDGALRGYKSSLYEGGIRTPLVMVGPGITPGSIIDEPVSTLDLTPTVLTAAGGEVPAQLDGRDLWPYLSANPPNRRLHDSLHWRRGDAWAIRQGEWKLVHTRGGLYSAPELYNLASDPAEINNVAAVNASRVERMTIEFTKWEAQLMRPRWGPRGVTIGQIDHFHWRPLLWHQLLPRNSKWSDSDIWRRSGSSGAPITLTPFDAYANTVLDFGTEDDRDYYSTNDMVRQSGLTFMMNRFLFSGDFTGGEDRFATIKGKDVLLVRNQADEGPSLCLNATRSTGDHRFTFNIDLNLVLLDDLTITGDGTEALNVNGNVHELNDSRSITKTGTSAVRFGGRVSLTGDFTIDGGQVEVRSRQAALAGFRRITVAAGTTLVLKQGLIDTSVLDNSTGTFQFDGGTLQAVRVIGNLLNNGGTFSPGRSPAASVVAGDYVQKSGMLHMEIGGATPGIDSDALNIAGQLQLGGTLEVVLVRVSERPYVPKLGDHWQLLTFGSVSGTFDRVLLPDLPRGLRWDTSRLPETGELAVAKAAANDHATLWIVILSMVVLGGLGLAAIGRRRWLRGPAS